MKKFTIFVLFLISFFTSASLFAQANTTQWDQPIHRHVSERKIVNSNQDTVIIRTIYDSDCAHFWDEADFNWDEIEDFGLYPYLELGINNWVNDRSIDNIPEVKGWGSWQIALGLGKRYRIAGSNTFFLHVGGDFSWYNFKFSDPSYRINTSTGKAFFEKEMSNEIQSKKSKLTISYFTLHAMPQVYLKNLHIKFGLGVYGGLKLGSHTKTKFEEHGELVKRKDFGLNEVSTWRYGVKGQVTFRWLTIYTQFDLNGVFKSGKGPELKPFAMGIRFAPF